jgi:hypothetical protein
MFVYIQGQVVGNGLKDGLVQGSYWACEVSWESDYSSLK